ncbi:hypothetical protein NAB2_1756 [Lactiplantibacillus plantarum]|uniref:Uncharacterized protein n=1 Tax=Lactiplantibacillus plantarum TaxID=1590 RepID=A0AAW3RD75_LACPN|nr:hypothetical protein NAB2_1756 [Lactiplantibacillus plantarum]
MPSQRINAVLALVRWRSKHSFSGPDTFREAAQMANERPPNSVQFVVRYLILEL